MAEAVTELQPAPKPELPDVVTVSATPDMRLSPNDMRQLKAETGRTLTELTGEDADDADQMQTMTWLKLRRDGYDVRWSDCADIAVDFKDAQPDPSNGEP